MHRTPGREKLMTGIALVTAFVIAIVLIIVMISRFKIHPFIAIMLVSFVFGLAAGIPLVDTVAADGTPVAGIASIIGSGFSDTFTSIGIVVILGALIGAVLEATGAAFKLADMAIKLVGRKRPEFAMELMGWVVSIPVFCDSGFVILNPIRKAVVQRTGAPSAMLTVALSSGLYISHVFLPPTPGPIAAAGMLGIENDLLLVMGVGALASIPPLIVGALYARFIGSRVTTDDEADPEAVVATYGEIVIHYGKMPGAASTLVPIVAPIVLLALGTISAMLGWTGPAADLCAFFGAPIVALAVGVLFSVFQLMDVGKLDQFYDLVQETLKLVGPILFVTAAGGVLGKVLSSSDMAGFIESKADTMQAMGIFFPFLLAAVLKTAQGSSTVAITTTAGIVAPLMGTLGFTTPVSAALAVMAIGAGAMTVSHANDSYFWVVTNFGGMTPQQGYKTQTAATALLGLSSILGIWALSLVF